MHKYGSMFVVGLAMVGFTIETTEAMLLQLKHRYDLMFGPRHGDFSTNPSEGVLLQLKNRYDCMHVRLSQAVSSPTTFQRPSSPDHAPQVWVGVHCGPLAMVGLATKTTETIFVQIMLMHESIFLVGLASGLFTNDITEAVLLHLKHRYGSVFAVGLTMVSFATKST